MPLSSETTWRRKRGVLFFALLFSSGRLFATSQDFVEKAHELKLADARAWRRLLHYHSNLFSADSSDINGPGFFLSPHGRKDPQAELDATIDAFFEPISTSTETQHPRCRYPARFDWLDEKLCFGAALPPIVCERYESWREKIDPAAISIVFSGYYLNNPSSMYGHTFLRVGRKSVKVKGVEERPLLDYSINFAAKTDTRSGLAFAVLGLAGGYPGTFTAVPYYMKVQHYNNLESRDLWEYKLTISEEGVNRLIKHLWEMGPTYISYYFLNKNCSYQLLPMLEVADPSLNLSERFRFRGIPVDTLAAVIEQPGLLDKAVFRPSALRRMIASRDRLTPEERKIAEGFVVPAKVGARFLNHPQKNVEELDSRLRGNDDKRRRYILEAAYDYLHYRAGYYRNQPEEVQERERMILLAMNALPPAVADEKLAIPQPAPPQAAHPTGRVGFGVGATRENGFEEISARGALHDLEADPAGFVSGSALEMMSARIRMENDNGRVYVEEATGIQVKSLAPWEPWIHKPSWQLKIAYGRAHDLGEPTVRSGQAGISGGSGISMHVPGFRDGIAYVMVETDAAAGHVFRDGYRLGIGPGAGVVGGITRSWRAHLIVSYLRYGVGDPSNANRIRLIQALRLPKDFEVRLGLDRQNNYQEGMLSLNHYF